MRLAAAASACACAWEKGKEKAAAAAAAAWAGGEEEGNWKMEAPPAKVGVEKPPAEEAE